MDARALDFVAALEPALQHIEVGEENKDSIRQQVTGLLINHRYHQTLPREELEALTQLRKDNTILVIPADKGRATVVMDKAQYVCKALTLLEDTTAYRIVSGDPMVTLKNRVNKVLNAIKRARRLDDDTLARIRPSDTATARFYGLPKVHKEGVPLRPIVSFRNTPTSGLAKWLSHRIGYLVNDSHTTVRSAEDFLGKIKDLRIEDDEVMVSFDVVSLFTSIPQDLAVKTISDLLHLRGLGWFHDSLRPDDLVDLLGLSLKTYFTFQGIVYEQIKGTPMGSPISSIIAEAVLQQLEHVAMTHYRPRFWARYVDDTFVVIKRSQKADFVDALNSVCVDIQFTEEEEHQGRLAFLDVLIHRQPDGTLRTKVYRKPTHTDRILHFHSNHPVAHKVSCIRTLFKRVDSHCNTARAKMEERRHLFRTCKRNGYPAKFIKRYGISFKPAVSSQTGVLPSQTTRVTLPYVSNVSEATARLLAPYNIKIAHKPDRTLRSCVMKPKDPLPTGEKSGVVYRVNCSNCPSNYVGETAKRLKTRIQEHKLAIRRGECYSQMLTHMEETGHKFDFNGARVVANDVTKGGRLVKEAWLSCKGAINRHIDLRPAYMALRAWETHDRITREKRPHNTEPTISWQASPQSNGQRPESALLPPSLPPLPPFPLVEAELSDLSDDRHTLPMVMDVLDSPNPASYQLRGRGHPNGMAGAPHDDITMRSGLTAHCSPHLKGTALTAVTWEENTSKSPIARAVTRSRTAAQRTREKEKEKDIAAIGSQSTLEHMEVKGEKHQPHGVERHPSYGVYTTPSDDRRRQQRCPRNGLRTGLRENGRRVKATPPSSAKEEPVLPYTLEDSRTPTAGEAVDNLGVAVYPLGTHGRLHGVMKAPQDRTTVGQPFTALDFSCPGTAMPLTAMKKGDAGKPPSPRMATRSRTAQQRTGSASTRLCPVSELTEARGGRCYGDEAAGGPLLQDTHTTPLEDQRGVQVNPGNELRAIRKRERMSKVKEWEDGNKGGGGNSPITLKHLKEECRREYLERNDDICDCGEMARPPALVANMQNDGVKPVSCAKNAVITRMGPVTRSRSRAQAPTHI